VGRLLRPRWAVLRRALTALGDAVAHPIVDDRADAVLLAYVPFHLADPALALEEAARVPPGASSKL
jgi:ubiquinone/menaquinone biosynthesis C-methylase UbiE